MKSSRLILYYDTFWGMPPFPATAPPEGFELTMDRKRYAAAEVVVLHIPQWKWKPRFLFPKKLPGQIWVAMSMECEENYPRLKDPAFLRAFDVTLTYRYDSDVPIPYLVYYSSPPELFDALRKTPPSKTAPVPAVSFISSRINASGRRGYVRELMQSIPTHSYGKFRNNIRLAEDRGRASKTKTLGAYKFTLAFENAIAHDYVTEKFFDPLISGSVPVYLGAPNVDEHAPGDHSFINANAFSGPRALAEYLDYLLHDDDAYNAYLAWKKKPFNPLFVARANRCGVHSSIRLCEWLSAHT